jgi:hypothetical protein
MKFDVRSTMRVAGPLRRLTIAPAANRIIAVSGAGAFLLDPDSGKQIAKLPAGIAAMDPTGARAVVTKSGATRGGTYRWSTELWDLARGKRATVLAENEPDDKLGPVACGREHVWAVHSVRGRDNALVESLVRFDARGKRVGEIALTGAPMVFWLALTTDEQRAAHLYFDGRGGLVEPDGGKRSKLAGVKGIGRDHDLGVTAASFDTAGAHLLAVTHRGARATVWNVRSRKQVAGAWTELPIDGAFLVGGHLCGVNGQTLRAASLGGGSAGKAMTATGAKATFAALGDDRHAVSLGGAVEVWDVAAGKRAAHLKSPVGPGHVLAAAGGLIAVGTESGRIAILQPTD